MITIEEDSILEGSEVFTLELQLVSAEPLALGNPNVANVTIIDDDSKSY